MLKDQAKIGKIKTSNKFVSVGKTILIDIKRNKSIYLMFLPIFIYYVVFCYVPMNGIIMAFQSYTPGAGILKSPFIGLENFSAFIGSHFFTRLVSNTLLLSMYSFIFGFPCPIILALLLNEVKYKVFKRVVQTITYIPNFIAITVIIGIMRIFLARQGVVNSVINFFGAQSINFIVLPEWFRALYISSGIWQGVGFGTIIYLAAIASLGTEVYEAALIDGAGRLKQAIYITLPGLMPTIAILMIFSLGGIMNVDTGKILLMYSPLTYETADVIGTYIYRKGIIASDYSSAAAMGLLNSVISFLMVVLVNKISKSISDYSIW